MQGIAIPPLIVNLTNMGKRIVLFSVMHSYWE